MSRRSIFLLAGTVVLLYFSIIVFMLSPLHGARRAYYSSAQQRFRLRGPGVAWCKEPRFRPAGAPAALASFPGSGNTWLRYLLQQATGILTGSVYMDYGLKVRGFPAENVTDGTVLVVKTHEAPPTDGKFKAAVLLVRNPRDAILADFNRHHKGHIGTAPRSAFKMTGQNHKKSEWAAYVSRSVAAWESLHARWLSRFAGRVRVLLYAALVRDTRAALADVLAFLNHTVPEKMATNNKEKIKMATVALPGCPRCLATLSPPIFLCTGGHSVCGACAAARPQVCQPVLCQQALTQIRNLTLEYVINKAKVACPNHAAGCPQTLLNAAVSDHLQDCAFRDVACPLATALGKCSWTGQWKQILEHVKEKHSSLSEVGLEADKELEGITLRDCDRQVSLAVHQKLVFIVTFKIDSVQRLAYWSVQLAGPKKLANQYVYEIHVSSKRDALRNVTFTEICSSDTVRADDIFRQFACPVLSLDSLVHFVKDDKLSFRYSIRTKTGPTKPKGESNVTADGPRPAGGAGGSGPKEGPGQNGGTSSD